jgi:hypothetical protein
MPCPAEIRRTLRLWFPVLEVMLEEDRLLPPFPLPVGDST